ncbi:peptidoglycan-binding protein [Streptomyces sp. NBC_01591]|nr:peptidoglycan-binding domain-containing protein [Streptomyces sp. NBC_01591]WSD68956.1 peptidoglycan-binding protein [Streptomyces sp. NBC_01591]
MRTMTRAFIGATTAIAIAGGGVAAAGTAFAASGQTTKAVASATAVTPLAVVNLGLNATQAKKLQRDLKANWGYKGAIDGQLGTDSWKAMQRFLKANWGYKGAIDGIAGAGTKAALARYCNSCATTCAPSRTLATSMPPPTSSA